MTLDSKFYNTSLRLYVFVVQRTVEQEKVLSPVQEKVLSLTVADQFINLLIRCEHKQNMVHPGHESYNHCRQK